MWIDAKAEMFKRIVVSRCSFKLLLLMMKEREKKVDDGVEVDSG